MPFLRWVLLCWVSGITFWLPSIAIHAVRGKQFGSSSFDLILITILPVVAAVAAFYLLAQNQPRPRKRRNSVALWMLAGIWMLGPLCIMTGASFDGGGFFQPGTFSFIFFGFVLPPLTFVLSTYDGTLLALAMITIGLMVAAISNFIRKSATAAIV